MKAVFSLLRPLQWLKNCVVFMPPFFGGNIHEPSCWLGCAVAFACFSMASSAVYCLNDVVDRDSDRHHPKKCQRPVASGKISVGGALTVGALCVVAALALVLTLPIAQRGASAMVLSVYLALNVAYCLKLKQVAIVDAGIVASGYVLRLISGSIVSDVILSPWIVIVTFLFTMFLSMAKRRSDVLLRQELPGHNGRQSTRGYTLPYVNAALGMLASATFVAYLIYSVSPEVTAHLQSQYIYLTSIFVLLGLLRYLQLCIVRGEGDNPVKTFLSDIYLMLCAAGWLGAFALIIYC